MPALTLALLLAATSLRAAEPLRLWHAYRGGEEQALEKVASQFKAKTGVAVELLSVPYDAFAAKLIAAIPHGNGPDVFIFSHPRLGSFHRLGLIASAKGEADPEAYLPNALDALRVEGEPFGYPLSLKCLALYLRPDVAPKAPRTTDELEATLVRLSDPAANRFGLAYESGDFYYHAPILFGFGGKLFDEGGRAAFDTKPMADALAWVRGLQDRRLIPQEATGALVKSLFNTGKAAMAISGPWFAGEIPAGVPYEVHPLPVVSATGLPMAPLLEVEAAFVSGKARHRLAHELARFLSTGEAAGVRVKLGRQIPADKASYRSAAVKSDRFIASFQGAARSAIPMPGGVEMSRVWEPMKLALRGVLMSDVPASAGGSLGDRRYRALYRPVPPRASPVPYVLGLLVLAGGWLLLQWRSLKAGPPVARRYPQLVRALCYVAPAAVGILVLIVVPFGYGLGLSFFHHDAGRYTFVGLANFVDILGSSDYRITEPMSFYFTLAVTVLWTAANVALHLGVGLALALLLRSPLVQLRGVYRVLLILPWAIPNYITALLWKGMFHRQFGAINGLLDWLGLEPISWFSRWSTAFAANLATNTWLGFPFMMVVALGALQSIPAELYEAAEVDGASPWTQFRRITLPLLKPALMPAVTLGVVWTFNMFNIIYLVSGGEPGGSTDILVSEAYRWAFQRNEQYGFAAAYSALIFLILWSYSAATGGTKAKAPKPAAALPEGRPAPGRTLSQGAPA